MTNSNKLREIVDNDTAKLYDRIEAIRIMPEADALHMFNTDDPDEYIALLYEEIAELERRRR